LNIVGTSLCSSTGCWIHTCKWDAQTHIQWQ